MTECRFQLVGNGRDWVDKDLHRWTTVFCLNRKVHWRPHILTPSDQPWTPELLAEYERLRCPLCAGEFTTLVSVKFHMRRAHGITEVSHISGYFKWNNLSYSEIDLAQVSLCTFDWGEYGLGSVAEPNPKPRGSELFFVDAESDSEIVCSWFGCRSGSGSSNLISTVLVNNNIH